MADVVINVRVRNEASDALGDLTRQIAFLERALGEGLRGAIQANIDAQAEHVRQSIETREHIEGLADAQVVLNDFWREARGDVEDYAAAIKTTVPSVVDLVGAEEALSAAIAANVNVISVAIDAEREKQTELERARDAYERAELATRVYEAGLLNTSQAALEAERRIAAVGRVVRDTDPSEAERRLRDFDDAFELSSVSVPRLTSAIGDFTGTLPDASRSIRDTSVELQNLSRDALQAARDADFLSASFADIDAFDPQTPDRRAVRRASPDFDVQGFAIRQAEELARAFIRLGGDLLRADRERAENLEALERDTTERIIAINARKAERLADISRRIEAEETRRIAAIAQAFSDAREAEIAAREDAAAAIARIEADGERRRRRAQTLYYQELRRLEADLARDIQRIRDGLAEREARRQAEIIEITERAAADRVAAEERYAQEIVEINRNLVERVRALRSDLAERLAALDAGLLAREAERAEQLIAIDADAAARRLVAAERYSETVIAINRNLVNQVLGLQARLADRLAALDAGLVEREAGRAAQLVAIEASAVDDRLAAEERYQGRVIEINRDLVERVQDLYAGLVETLTALGDGLLAREADRADALVAIEADAAAARVDAQGIYQRRIDAINRDLVSDVRSVQAEIERIERDAVRDRADVIADAAVRRADAESDYRSRVQGIYNDLASDIESIERRLSNRLDSIRDRRLSAERERQETLADLERGRRESVSDLFLEFGRDVEDLLFERGLGVDIHASELGRRVLGSRGEVPSAVIGSRDPELLREIAALRIAFLRDVEDLNREQLRETARITEQTAREEAEFERQAADAVSDAETDQAAAEAVAGVDAATALANAVPALTAMEQAAAALAESLATIDAEELSALRAIEVASTQALAAARAEILALETAAGTSFAVALANLVPEVDASTAALNVLNTTLAEINATEASRRDAVIAAGEADRAGVADQSLGAVGDFVSGVAALEGEAGISFEDALGNYVPALDLSTQALNAFNAAITEINANLVGEREGIIAAGELDRESVAGERADAISETDAQIAALEADAGISFEDALANFVPEVDASTAALQAFSGALLAITADAAARREGVIAAGVLDRETVAGERADAISETGAAIAGLEAEAGITFDAALVDYVPALNATTQALVDLTDALDAINRGESEALAGVTAAGAADRLSVDEEIAARREQFDTDIRQAELDQVTRLIDIEYATGQQIADVNAQLKVRLGEISDTLSATLTAIRENKIAFDNAIFVEIRDVESQAAAAIGEVRADAAIMRAEIEAIAEEARNNAWKAGLLKMANVGITIAGAAAGLVIAGPPGAVAGAQAGAAVGGLVEQAGNELFHFPQNDLMAFRAGQQAARGTSVAFSPDAAQRQNAQDFSKYFGEGFASERGSQASGSGGGERPVIVQLVLNDRVVQEVFTRGSELRSQDRILGL